MSERKILLSLGDIAASTVALIATVVFRSHLPWQDVLVARNLSWLATLALTWSLFGPLLDAYDLRQASRPSSGIFIGARAAGVIGLMYLLVPRYTPTFFRSRLTALTFVVSAVTLVGCWRYFYALVLARKMPRSRAAIVGFGPGADLMIEAISRHHESEYELVDLDSGVVRASSLDERERLIDRAQDLRWLVDGKQVEEIILAVPTAHELPSELLQVIVDAHEQGIVVHDMVEMYEQVTGSAPVDLVGLHPTEVLPLGHHQTTFTRIVKRLMDVAFGTVLILLGAAFAPLIAIANLLEGGGSLLYRQRRLGLAGRPFKLAKFRTMIPGAEESGPQWTVDKDPRTTRIGRIVRRLHIDELPQGWNILRGQMSLVGPRPERPEFVESLEKEIPYYRARNAIRPGLTGWAQVNVPYGASIQEAVSKLRYDIYYIKHLSPRLDTVIVLKTLWHVLGFRGR